VTLNSLTTACFWSFPGITISYPFSPFTESQGFLSLVKFGFGFFWFLVRAFFRAHSLRPSGERRTRPVARDPPARRTALLSIRRRRPVPRLLFFENGWIFLNPYFWVPRDPAPPRVPPILDGCPVRPSPVLRKKPASASRTPAPDAQPGGQGLQSGKAEIFRFC